MRFNDHALRTVARGVRPDREGRLYYRAPRDSYKERWFKLKGNLLFFFKTNEHGSVSDSDALGVMVVERCSINLEPLGDRPFVFSIAFEGEGDRKHYFSGQTVQHCQDWVTALQTCSIEHLKAELALLRSQVQKKTGKDPMDTMLVRSFGKMTLQRHSVPAADHRVRRNDAKFMSAPVLPQETFTPPTTGDLLASWEHFE